MPSRTTTKRPGTETSSSAKVVTPTKKKNRIQQSEAGARQFGCESTRKVILTERVMDGEAIVLKVMKEDQDVGAFSWPIHKKNVKSALAQPFEPHGQDEWDVACTALLFERASHEQNHRKQMTPTPTGKGGTFHRCVLFSWPNADKHGTDGKIDIGTEEKLRNLAHSIIRDAEKDGYEDQFAPWDISHSLTKTPFRSLDQILTDESIGHVLTTYHLPKDLKESDSFGYMMKNGIKNVFTRKKSNGRFSKFAMRLGFPTDTLIPSDSAFEDDSDLVF